MIPTTTPMSPEFVRQIFPWLLQEFDNAKGQAFKMIWNIFWDMVTQHWISIAIFLLALLFVSGFQAFATGHWGWFASVLYHYFYGGIMIAIGFIFGPEIFANTYFEIVAVFAYALCFWLVGRIIRKTGLRRF